MQKKKFMSHFPGIILIRVVLKRKEELFLTGLIMLFLMLFSSICIYFFERVAQPEAFSSICGAMWWAVAALTTVGYGDVYPITIGGKIFAACIAISGIGLFALPAGILGGGFVEEIEDLKEQKKLKQNSDTILNAMESEQSIKVRKLLNTELNLMKKCKFLDLEEVMAKLNYSNQDIIEIVRFCPELRIRPCKQNQNSLYNDNMILESFKVNTSFGSFENRNSNIHIISTQSVVDMSLGHFASVLSEALNANFYSNELFSLTNLDKETRINFSVNKFYNEREDGEIPSPLNDWINIMDKNIKEDDLVIYLGVSDANRDPFVHLLCGGKKGEEDLKNIENPTFNNIDKFENFSNNYSKKMIELEMPITGHSEFGNTNKNHIAQVLRNKNKANTTSLFISEKILQFSSLENYYKTIRILADSIKESLV